MRRFLPCLVLVLAAGSGAAHAHGLLIPVEKTVPPLAMVNHQVDVTIEDQVAITRVEQTFRNHTDRELEATYIFPVPKGASVQKFSMWVGGSEVKGELVEAAKAREIYTGIVRRTLDPGLLEYLGNNLFQVKVFPVPPRGEQKLAIRFSSVVPGENGLAQYVYPLKTSGKAIETLEKFSVKVSLKAQHPLQNIYSPSHAITVSRANDREAQVAFEKNQGRLDRDFVLYYSAGGKDVGLTALTHRPGADVSGHFLLLISPRAELSKSQQVPRDMVFVLDTSGSMRGKRIEQAKKALQFCLENLGPRDRFGLMNFATTVSKYDERLLPATSGELTRARKWVEQLEATGGTAINDALAAALDMRGSDPARNFTIVFFTDGQPTIGETDIQKILKNVAARNTASTRIFSFGVGDDVNATFLDSLSEQSRALSTYVRESEDISDKVSGLYAKISNPVLTNLKLSVGGDVKLAEVYPPQLPDLFHGTQLVVLGRYSGKGHVAVKLSGNVEKETRDFVYEMTFPAKTADDKTFVEDLWARRKVGYLLDEIRRNGEKKELVDEVVILAKRYGIATPYTSHLIVPDGVTSVVKGPQHGGRPNVRFGADPKDTPDALAPREPGAKQVPLKKLIDSLDDDVEEERGRYEDRRLGKGDKKKTGDGADKDAAATSKLKSSLEKARGALRRNELEAVQAGELGVDLSLQTNGLRNQNQTAASAVQRVQGRQLVELGGVWIDDGFKLKTDTVTVKAMSKAYFRILERQPQMRDVFRLGNYLVFVTPSRKALVIDLADGREDMSDADIDRLFTTKK
jgi:Ca-activated chloride channel family protein